MRVHGSCRGLGLIVAVVLVTGAGLAIGPAPTRADSRPVSAWLTQVPDVGPAPYEYGPPPAQLDAPVTSIPPSNQPLGPEELKRAEALLPLLEGKQELWAIGEFVHLGKPVVPVLTKALAMPSPRIRYNAIETSVVSTPSQAGPVRPPRFPVIESSPRGARNRVKLVTLASCQGVASASSRGIPSVRAGAGCPVSRSSHRRIH